MFSQEEQVSLVDQQWPEDAEIEEVRVRQSELVNMNVVVLHRLLHNLYGGSGDAAAAPLAADGSALTAACLPPEIIDALASYLSQSEEEVRQLHERAQLLEEQSTRDTARVEAVREKTEKLKDTVAALSAKSSADVRAFRTQMQQSANAAKQRQRELVDLTRKRERLELEVKRTAMEVERLGKIAKHVR